MISAICHVCFVILFGQGILPVHRVTLLGGQSLPSSLPVVDFGFELSPPLCYAPKVLVISQMDTYVKILHLISCMGPDMLLPHGADVGIQAATALHTFMFPGFIIVSGMQAMTACRP